MKGRYAIPVRTERQMNAGRGYSVFGSIPESAGIEDE
jgi:hypothetical protein